MNQLLHILKYKLITFLRLDTKLSLSSISKSVGSGIIYVAFGIGSFFFAKNLIHFLLVEVAIGKFLLHEFFSMILFIFFLSINIGNIIVSYSTLYKSNEINFLLTKPIEPAKIFIIKFLDNFFYSSSTLLMVLSSLLIGYAVYFKMDIYSILLLLFNFIPYMFSAGSLGVIILLVLVKAADIWGVKKIFYTLILSYLTIIFVFFRINSPNNLVMTVLKFYPYISKDIYLGNLIPPIIKVMPNNWLAQSAYWSTNGNMGYALQYTILQILLSVLLFGIAYILGKKYYFKTWLLNLKILADINTKRKEVGSFTLNSRRLFFRNQIQSIIRRDLLLFLREPSQVIHFMVLLFLNVVFIVSVAGIKFVGLGNFYLQTMIYLSIFLFNLLLISTLSLRFIFPLISLEGLAFWKIKSSPLKLNDFILSKLIVFSLVTYLISITLSVISNFRFGLILVLFSLVVTVLATTTIISINFGMGGFFANYKEKNPIRISSSQGASLTFLLNLIYLLFVILLLFKPFSELFLSLMINKNFYPVSLFWKIFPMLIITLILTFAFHRLAYISLKKDFSFP
jgi:ABC-2 type transport system permease protein